MENAARASSRVRADRDRLEYVQGQIAFVRRTSDEKAPETTVSGYDEPMVSHDVTIRSARPIADELSVDREGFALIQHKISCANERDPDIMRDAYLGEMVPLIKNYFNASRVVPRRQGVVMRRYTGGNSDSPREDRPLVQARVAGFAHIDLMPIAAPMVAALEEQLLANTIRSYSRLMIIQAWRALSPPPQDSALAFCDSTSILDTDLVETTYRRFDPTHKMWLLHYSPLQRWYYFPEMTENEFILFKTYDSEDSFSPRSAHSAFDNRRAYPNARPRESIEARFIVYFD